ncbi:MAG: efflux RND transporter periplasmic adaptor subunit [Burkholderiales bacterium]|nr:efflux RND transporter periplasmic adaptor subunit [Burkholderiales bacterium]
MNPRFPSAVLLSSSLLLGLAACSKSAPPPEPVRAVKTMVIAPASAGSKHEYAGEIRARTESRLGFRVGGKMVERPVNVGDAVKAGQVLARLDPRDLRLGEDVARAGVASAAVNLQQAEADFTRYRDLKDQGFISGAELERRETSLKVAQAQLAQARAQSGVQGNQAGYAALTADVGGVVTGVDVEPGMVVAAGAPVLRLAHDGPRDVVFSVPEDKVALVQAVMVRHGSIGVRLWSSGDEVPATIREISAAADPATRTFLVKADLGVAATPPRLGQTATVTIAAPRVAGVARIPLSALKEEHGRSIVWVVDQASMTAVSRPVSLGGAEGSEAVVVAGLAPGDRVVTAGVHVLSAGQKVRLYTDPEAPLGSASAPARLGRAAATTLSPPAAAAVAASPVTATSAVLR